MNEDLDQVYAQLMDIKADGGGDEPESVNAALFEAINRFAWSQTRTHTKLFF